jgi:hypothetical protein
MKKAKTSCIGLAIAALLLAFTGGANAWVAVGRPVPVHPVYHPPYYHPPTGCYGCGAAAGAMVGMAVGAAVATAAQPKAVVVQQPGTVVVQQPAYAVQGSLPLGSQLAVLPPGVNNVVVSGVTYYQSGANWYRPYYGSSGVYYEVVPAP